ncbi:helix-turn-helix transcriptional regulator [Gordonia sinesedis]
MCMTVESDVPTVGRILRDWRQHRRVSQQELSNLAAVSARHVSRVETGKAHPTPDMIIRLAEFLEIPLRERNRLLLAGGYAPRYSDDPWSSDGSATGLRGLLDAHLPYPALLLDDYWNVVDMNTAVDALLAGCAAELLEPPVNVIRLCLHPDGLAPRIANRGQWAGFLYQQLRSRAERTRDPRHHELAAELADHVDTSTRQPTPPGPVLTLDLAAPMSAPGEVAGTDTTTLRFFSTSARLTTATDAALEGLHLETFLPADEQTRQALGGPPPARAHDGQQVPG